MKKLSCKASAGETLLHAAARRGYIENLAYYITMGLSVDSADNAGFTPLHEAVTKEQILLRFRIETSNLKVLLL